MPGAPAVAAGVVDLEGDVACGGDFPCVGARRAGRRVDLEGDGLADVVLVALEVTKSRSGKTTTLSGKVGTAAAAMPGRISDELIRPVATSPATTAGAAPRRARPVATRRSPQR